MSNCKVLFALTLLLLIGGHRGVDGGNRGVDGGDRGVDGGDRLGERRLLQYGEYSGSGSGGLFNQIFGLNLNEI